MQSQPYNPRMFAIILVFLPMVMHFGQPAEPPPASGRPQWIHLSTAADELPIPSSNTQQTASLILDIDNDGLNDFVIGSRRGSGPSLVWLKREDDGWQRHIIEDETLNIEAGGAHYDIDQDGDLDIVMGGDNTSNQVWWWENPYPDFDSSTAWVRRTVKDSGSVQHHDQLFGDFDGDGQVELTFWNQGLRKLFLAEIPENPRDSDSWPITEIQSASGSKAEGLTKADIDGDGIEDIIGGGSWFKYEGEASFTRIEIDDDQRLTRTAAGQLIPGGRPEVVFVNGEDVGMLRIYVWDGTAWIGEDLLSEEVDHSHSLQIVDVDQDGHLDIFYAEMRLSGGNSDAKMKVLYGDSSGEFTVDEVASGFGNHESKIADLDGDGDLDILGKPYNWETPRLDVWINDGNSTGDLDQWCRRVIDNDRPWRSVFVTSADIDGDNQADIVSGGWWYKNPGAADGHWARAAIGDPLNNFATVYDFDDDGDLDILGTTGKNTPSSDTFVWARNDGTGNFVILDNVEEASGDFLQGVAVERFQSTSDLDVALSWHASSQGVQMLSVPADPSNDIWAWRIASDTSQNEELSSGDIDRDNDIDLLLGTQWLRNEGSSFTPMVISETSDDPDRNRLIDMNGDGRLDAVVGFEAISVPGKLAWYEQPASLTSIWTEHIIASVVGPMSLDTVDMDQDGDFDVIVGEHNLADSSSARMLIYENVDGFGQSWSEHVVHTGDEHHDGAHVTDIDADGDYDIVSIGWGHRRVLLYENTDQPCDGSEGTPTSAPTQVSSTPTSTPTQGSSTIPPTPTQGSSTVTVTPTPTASLSSATAGGNRLIPTPTPSMRLVRNSCRKSDLEALYMFDEGTGSSIYDVAGTGSPLNLVISAGKFIWLPKGGLEILEPTLIISNEPASHLVNAIKMTDELSVELWIEPEAADQFGPARIMTLSSSPTMRNFTLGQGRFSRDPKNLFDVRLRTTSESNDDNGEPSITTEQGTAKAKLTHIVYTRNKKGEATIYIDGTEVHQSVVTGTLGNWDDAHYLSLANEVGGERPWLGKFHQVAIYSCSLSEFDVTKHHAIGLNPGR